MKPFLRNSLKFITIFIIFITIIIFFLYFTNFLNKNLQIVEPMVTDTNTNTNTNLSSTKSDAFCKTHEGASATLNDSCLKLTNNNCKSTSCCVLVNGSKCVAGSKDGPTYNSDENGKTIDNDYYYYQDKCYGKACP